MEEQQVALNEMSTQLTKTEADLTRIRLARDELLQDQSARKAREDAKFSATKEIQELAEARAAKIQSLELEVERLKTEIEKDAKESDPDLDKLDLPQLRQKHDTLRKAHNLLSQELPALEQAYKLTSALGNKKVADLKETEDKLKRLLAEVC